MKAVRVIMSALLAVNALTAHQEVRWLEFGSDFGLMKEEAGPKTMGSHFVNMGSEPVSIFSVRPSCGCTSASFSDEPVAPGDTALITYTYDPKMRPGKFEKSVKVRLSDGSHYSLPIRGNVLGTPESLASLYPVEAGRLRLSDAIVDAGRMLHTRTSTSFVNAYVTGTDSVVPHASPADPALAVTPSCAKAGPGDVVTFSLMLSAPKAKRFGPVEIPVNFSTDKDEDSVSPGTVKLRAFITPDPARLAALQKGKNPKIHLDSDFLALPVHETDSGQATGLTVSNMGNGPLEIYGLFLPDACGIKTTRLPGKIKAGKSGEIILQAGNEASGFTGRRYTAELITNDPDHPVTPVTISLIP